MSDSTMELIERRQQSIMQSRPPHLSLLLRATVDRFRRDIPILSPKELIELSTMLDASLHVERMRIDAINDRLKQLIDEGGEVARHEAHLSNARSTAEKNLQNYCKKQTAIDDLKSRSTLSPQSFAAPVEHISPTPTATEPRTFVEQLATTREVESSTPKSVFSATTSTRTSSLKEDTPRKTYVAKFDESPVSSERGKSPGRTKAIDRQALYDSQDRILSTIRRRDSKPRSATFNSTENINPEGTGAEFWKSAASPITNTPVKPKAVETWLTSTTVPTSMETLKHTDLEHTPIMETQTTSAQYVDSLTTTTVRTTRTFMNRSWLNDGDECAPIDDLEKSGHITPPSHRTTTHITETVLPPKVTTTTYTPASPALRETKFNTPHNARPQITTTEPTGPIMPLGARPKVDLADAQLTDAHILESRGGAAVEGDAESVKEWDPTPMMEDMYKIEYAPKLDRKQHRFVNMEGHLEHLPAGTKTAVSERQWAKHYFKTKEGRLLMYQTTYADSMHALTDVLIAGCEVTANRDDLTLTVHGGREHTYQVLRCPLALWETWRSSLISHAACSLTDSYVTPLYPPVASSWHQKTCIIEVGSASIRAGVMTNEHSLPQAFFPSLATVLENGDVVVGCEALKPEYRQAGTVVRPLTPILPGQERYTMNTPVMRCIIHHVFETLRITPALYNVLLTVPQNAPVAMIESLMRILLEDMHCKAVSVSRQPVLVLYAYDVTTGIVVDVGDRCNIVPVVDGYVVENAIVSLPYAGGQIKDALRAHMSEQKSGMYAFRSAVESYILRYLMEKSCYMAADYDAEVAKAKSSPDEIETTVSLRPFHPTKEMISDFKLTSERFTSTEGLLAPKRWSLDCQGLQKLIYAAIQTAPMDSRRPLYRNIYVAGGVSQMPNFVERLETELQGLVAQSIQVNVSMSPWRYHAAYLGAQIVAASKQFTDTLVTADRLDKFVTELNSQHF